MAVWRQIQICRWKRFFTEFKQKRKLYKKSRIQVCRKNTQVFKLFYLSVTWLYFYGHLLQLGLWIKTCARDLIVTVIRDKIQRKPNPHTVSQSYYSVTTYYSKVPQGTQIQYCKNIHDNDVHTVYIKSGQRVGGEFWQDFVDPLAQFNLTGPKILC